MNRSRGKTAGSVSLFPFLAVLVCAMGALIFLLLITTRRIREEALLRALAETNATRESIALSSQEEHESELIQWAAVEAPVPDVPAVVKPEPEPVDPNEQLREHIALLSRRLDSRRQILDERRRALTVARRRIAETRSRQDQLKRRLDRTRQELSRERAAAQAAASERKTLGAEIAESQARLRRVRRQEADRSTKYAVVPYDGQSGTTRRPILIKCTRDGLKFLQEDILLTADDLSGFTVGYNPLLAGTRALVEYWSTQDGRAAAEAGQEPYVLLIVRPGGAIAYYAARKLLSDLEQPSGYELLGKEIELDVPDEDPGATAACRRAIEETLAERRRAIRSIAAGRARNGPILRFQGGPGGFDLAENEAKRSVFDRLGQENFGRDESTVGNGAGPVGKGRFAGGARSGRRAGGDPKENLARQDRGKQPSRRALRKFTDGSGGREPDLAQSRTRYGRIDPRKSADDSSTTEGPRTTNRRPDRPGTPDTDSRLRSHGSRQDAGSGQSGEPNGNPSLRRYGNGRGSRGRPGWGIPGTPNGIGFERKTVIEVTADDIRVAGRPKIDTDSAATGEELTKRVLAELDRHARSWGRPPENFYWVPSVRFIVRPGGNRHYERLHGPLRKLGVNSTVEYRLDADQPE